MDLPQNLRQISILGTVLMISRYAAITKNRPAKKLMIMGVGIGEVAHEVAVLAVMTVVLLAIALKKFNVRLE